MCTNFAPTCMYYLYYILIALCDYVSYCIIFYFIRQAAPGYTLHVIHINDFMKALIVRCVIMSDIA